MSLFGLMRICRLPLEPFPGRSAARRSSRRGALQSRGPGFCRANRGPGSAKRHEECRIAPGTRDCVRHSNFKQPRLRDLATPCVRALPVNVPPSSKRGRAERRAPSAPAASHAVKNKAYELVTTVTPASQRSARNGLTACFVLSPVARSLIVTVGFRLRVSASG